MSIGVRVDWSDVRAPLSRGVQVGPVSVVADARVDNAPELAREMDVPADVPVTELLARAYLKWGEDCADHLSGDFAFVLWDARKQSLFVVRDPFGIRPLYYRASGSELWIASRVERVMETFDGGPSLDDRRVLEHLLERYTSAEVTFFREISQVPAGNVLVATRSQLVLRRYWNPPPTPSIVNRIDVRDYWEELRRLFLQSVRRRLRSDGPVTIHVSGGLDSSAIAGAADVLSRGGSAPAVSVVGAAALYPGLPCDESPFIEAVARRVTFPIERWDGTYSDAAEIADPHAAEPGIEATFTGGTIGDIRIARAYGGTVILSGSGGDQLGMVDGFVRDLIGDGRWLSALREMMLFPGATTSSRLGRMSHVLKGYLPAELVEWRANSRRAPQWLAPDLSPMLMSSVHSRARDSAPMSHVQRHAWERLTCTKTTRNLSRLAAQAYASGVEYRFPYLDKDLIEFALTIPYQYWPRPGAFARLHREAVREFVPPEIADRQSKAEFTPALANRVRRARAPIQTMFDRGTWASSRYVDRTKAQLFWRAVAEEGAHTRAFEWRQVWAVVTFEAWLRRGLGYYRRGPTKEAWS